MHSLGSPSDLLTQLLSAQESRTSVMEPRSRDNAVLSQEFLDLVLSFDVTSDGSD